MSLVIRQGPSKLSSARAPSITQVLWSRTPDPNWKGTLHRMAYVTTANGISFPQTSWAVATNRSLSVDEEKLIIWGWPVTRAINLSSSTRIWLFARHDCFYCIQDKWILQQPFSSSFITFIRILHYIRIISLSLVKIRSSQYPVHGSKIFMISPLFAILDTQGKNPDHSTWRGRNKPCWRLDRAPDWSTLQRQFPSLPMLFHLQSSFRFQSFEQPLQIVILQGKCPMWGFWRRQKVNQIYRINKLSGWTPSTTLKTETEVVPCRLPHSLTPRSMDVW